MQLRQAVSDQIHNHHGREGVKRRVRTDDWYLRPLAKAINLVKPLRTMEFQRGVELTVISVTIPCLIIASVNAYNLWTEHWEHWEHMAPLDERPEYPYQNLRTKNYVWGDGDKVSEAHCDGEVSSYDIGADNEMICRLSCK